MEDAWGGSGQDFPKSLSKEVCLACQTKEQTKKSSSVAAHTGGRVLGNTTPGAKSSKLNHSHNL